MKPGQYRAMINDVAFNGEDDKFHVEVQFNILDLKGMDPQAFDAALEANDHTAIDAAGIDLLDTSQQKTWFGSFKGGARPITVETLARLGASDLNNLMEGKGGLNCIRHYGLTLRDEVYNGITRSKISSVWIPGQGGFGSKLDAGSVKAQLAKLGLAGELAKAAQAVPQAPVAGF